MAVGAGQWRKSTHTRPAPGSGLGFRPRTSRLGLLLLLPSFLPSSLPSFLASPPPFTFPEANRDDGRARGGVGVVWAFIVGRTPRVWVPAPGGRGTGRPRREGVRPAGSGRRRWWCSGPESGACPATGSVVRHRLPGLPCAAGASLAPPLGSSP